MAPLEALFALEVEFHRRLRCEAPGTAETSALHTSYALQGGYEALLRGAGRVTLEPIERLAARFMGLADPRDVLAARDSLIRLLGLTRELR